MLPAQKTLVVNGRFLTQQKSGVQNYALGMMKALERSGTSFEIASPKDSNKGGIGGFIWEQFSLPRYVRNNKNAFLINFCNSAPLRLKQQAVVIHDLAFEADPGTWFKIPFRKWYRYMIPKLARNSELLLTVSEFSKREIAHHYRISDKKIKVIPNGIPEFQFDESIHVEGKYLLLTGTENPRKNAEEIFHFISAIVKNGYKLVVLSKSSGSFKEVNIPEHDHILHFKDLSSAAYFSLLKNASGLIYPSKYEGFGLPILESLILGTPVIASDLQVFKENFAGLPLYFINDITFEEALMKLPQKQITEKDKSELRMKFDFNNSIQTLLESINSLSS